MYAKRNLATALNNQRMFMDHMREDGRLPSVIYQQEGKLGLMFSHLQGYCFPWHALNVYYWMGKEDKAYLRRCTTYCGALTNTCGAPGIRTETAAWNPSVFMIPAKTTAPVFLTLPMLG